LLFRLASRDPRFALDLWHRLATLYRDELDDPASAAAALASALELAPGDPALRAELADVESGRADRFHHRVLDLRARLADAGDRGAGLALIEAADQADRPDLGFLAAAVVVALGDGVPAPVTERHQRYRPRFVRRASGRLDAARWDRLRHPADLPGLSRLFELLAAPIAETWPVGLEDLGAAPPADAVAPDLVRTRDYLADL